MTPPPPQILHEDLVIEILSWLPVKSLVRLKCVSKSFKSLISLPSFVKLHLQRSPKNANLLLRLQDPLKPRSFRYSSISLLNNSSFTIAEDLGFGRQFEGKYEYVIGSCNGLVCLAYGSTMYLSEEYRICLWNPATKLRSQESPSLVIVSKQCCISMFGFGYDSLSDTYKVVAILMRCSKGVSLGIETKVYNKGGNCWRNIQSFPGVPYLRFFEGVYLSGTLSWLAIPNSNHYCDFPAHLSIVSLNLGKETYRQFLLPCGFYEVHHLRQVSSIHTSLGVLKDRLCFYHDFKGTNFVVWQMNEYGVENSWTKLFNLSYQDLQIDYMQNRYLLPPLSVLENGSILMMAAYGRLQAILYNRIDNKVEHTEISSSILRAYATVYVQSLVSPSSN